MTQEIFNSKVKEMQAIASELISKDLVKPDSVILSKLVCINSWLLTLEIASRYEFNFEYGSAHE